MDNRTKHFIEVSSVVVALCAFFTATFMSYAEYKDKRAAVLPMISIEQVIKTGMSYEAEALGSMTSKYIPAKMIVTLKNTGFGVGRINKFTFNSTERVEVQGSEINGKKRNITEDWINSFSVLSSPMLLEKGKTFTAVVYFDDRNLPVNDSIKIMDIFNVELDCESIYRQKCEVYEAR